MIARKMMSTAAGATMVASAAFSSAASAQDDGPEMVQPSTGWNLNYGDSSCRLARIFGEGDDKIVLAIDRYWPGEEFQIMVAGKEMRRLTTRGAMIDVETRFGPFEEATEAQAFVGELGEYEPAIIIGLSSLGPDSEKEGDEELDWDDPARYEVDPAAEARLIAREARAEWLAVSRGSSTVYLATGPMGKPLAALRECTEGMLRYWDVDVEAHRSLTRRVMPVSSTRGWVDWRDYPSSLVFRGVQGLVRFRVTVDAEGKPLRCDVHGSTEPKGFDKIVCDSVMERSRFIPALDAQGEPIKSYYTGSIRFQIGD